MKFAIVSDTHDNIPAIKEVVRELEKEKVDFIVHAGDIIAPFALKEFRCFEEAYFVFGNNDGERKLLTSLVEKYGWVIGDIVEFPKSGFGVVYHGTDSKIVNVLLKSKYEILVLGHTHEPEVRREQDLLVVNPGEVCGYLTGKRTYALWEDGEVSIVEF